MLSQNIPLLFKRTMKWMFAFYDSWNSYLISKNVVLRNHFEKEVVDGVQNYADLKFVRDLYILLSLVELPYFSYSSIQFGHM